ncbi:MAG: FCD domain-containing protein [Sphingomonadales bacterium]|nr:FCD domain-containing protein [Sphingomonadales bacterium]
MHDRQNPRHTRARRRDFSPFRLSVRHRRSTRFFRSSPRDQQRHQNFRQQRPREPPAGRIPRLPVPPRGHRHEPEQTGARRIRRSDPPRALAPWRTILRQDDALSSIAEHDRIVSALERRDALRARDAIAYHFENAIQVLRRGARDNSFAYPGKA